MQRAPCGSDTSSTETTTELEQEERLQFIAELADANIRARLSNDSSALGHFTDEVLQDPFVYFADLSPECYGV